MRRMPDRSSPPARTPRPDDRVLEYKGFRLSRFQIRSIEALRQGRNVLVSAPTGAGKTLVAEYAIEDAMRRGRRCIYTAPIKALSNQKYRDFRDVPDVDVGLMTGDVTIHPKAQVLIMTTEILRNSIFENPDLLSDVDFVTFDEIHYMDDIERGSVWEESLIFAPPTIRFVCLSATISNLDQVGAWLAEIRPHEVEVVRSDDRPVPLRHRLYTHRQGIFTPQRLAWVQKRELAVLRRPRRARSGRGRGPGGRGGRRDAGDDAADAEGLFDTLVAEGLLPALVFSFSRRDCERLAYRSQRRQLLDADEERRMAALQDELVKLFQLDEGELLGEIFQLALRGIGYHHAGMLPVHKELVERMFTSGLLKLLFTTETFALGINMPARTVVFQGLRKFDGVKFDYLRTRDYMQMAGRAGRQGIDEEGLVVAMLGTRDLAEAPIERWIGGKPEPVDSRFRLAYSTLLHLLAHLGRERVHEAWEKSFDRFQHRERSARAREHNRLEQRRVVDSHLDFLEDLGYVEDGDKLTARGRVARSLYGFELQLTEMLFRGSLENLPAAALAMVFVALIYEERRPWQEPYVSPRMFGGVRRHVGQLVARLAAREASFRIPSPMKTPDWGLTPQVLAWVEGATFEEIEEIGDATPGDVCRTFRMGIQLLRQVKRAIDPAWDLGERLQEAIDALNRDEVDARRQLELG